MNTGTLVLSGPVHTGVMRSVAVMATVSVIGYTAPSVHLDRPRRDPHITGGGHLAAQGDLRVAGGCGRAVHTRHDISSTVCVGGGVCRLGRLPVMTGRSVRALLHAAAIGAV